MRKSLSSICVAALVVVSGTAARAELNHPTGTKGLFLVDKLGTHVRFFDPVTYQEISSIELPKAPHDFVFSADHKLAYVPIYGTGVYGKNPSPGHEIAIIDLEARKVTGMIDVAPYRAPHGIQIDKQGTLYVTCDLDRKVLVIDPKTHAIRDTMDTEGTGHWISMLPDASKIYVANKNDKPFITVLDVKTRKIVARVPAPNGVQGIAASPDGKRVVAIDFTDPVLIVIDPKTDTVIDRIALKNQTKGAYKVYFSPDGAKLLTMSDAAGLINIFDATNLKGEQKVLTVGKDPMGFAFSADGKTALVANHGDGSVSIVDLQAGVITGNFHGGTGIETLAWY
jgi:DNA-binding beta-propeller fold protein YncE